MPSVEPDVEVFDQIVHLQPHFRVGADGLWVLHDMSDGTVVTLASVGCEVPMVAVFEGVAPA